MRYVFVLCASFLLHQTSFAKEISPCGTRTPTEAEIEEAHILIDRWEDHVNKEKILSQKIVVPTSWHRVKNGDEGNSDEDIEKSMEVLNSAFAPNFIFKLDNIITSTVPDFWDIGAVNSHNMRTHLHQGNCNTLNIYSTKFSQAGYATFPRYCALTGVLDGVIIDYETVPDGHNKNYNRGYTLVHEVGHWLGLYHIFENGCSGYGDGIDDTPPMTRTVKCKRRNSCKDNLGKDLVNNFMGYSADKCRESFTEGQVAAMRANWYTFRHIRSTSRVAASEYSDQRGIEIIVGIINSVDNGDYITYSSFNFGESGTDKTVKGILINHSKGYPGGTIEIRLGDSSGTIIAQFNPAKTGSWSYYQTAYIGIEDVTGVHDVTFVAKGGYGGIFNLAWFELSDFSERRVHARVAASEYSDQRGIEITDGLVNHVDNGDYITYSSLDFGEPGSTKGILINHSKGSSSNGSQGGTIEIRLGDLSGTIIAQFNPAKTGSWYYYQTVYIGIGDVAGVHDVTFVFKGGYAGIINLAWFELSDFSERRVHARVAASEYSDQRGIEIIDGIIDFADDGVWVTYSSLDFGEPGTANSTKGILINHSKNSQGGMIEIRLGDSSGTAIAQFNPSRTSYNKMAYIGIEDVAGVHDVTLVAKGGQNILNLTWFELSNLHYECIT